MTTAEIGIFGGSGFYSLLDGVEEVEVDTPYGEPSAPAAVGDIGGTSTRHTASRTGPTCGR